MIEKLPKATKTKNRALIVEGGGMKGAFAGGALAVMSQIHPVKNYDLIVAVSSGACSAAYFATEPNPSKDEIEHSLKVWRHELTGRKLISLLNPLKGKTLLNQDYLVDELFGDRYPLKSERLDERGATLLYIALTNLTTLEPEYVRATSENVLPLLKTAISLPIATKGRRKFDGQMYTDGGISDPIPIQAVLNAGYTDITVVLNQPRYKLSNPYGWLLSWMSFPKHPKAAKYLMTEHHRRYNNAKNLLVEPPRGVRMRIVDPRHKLPAHLVTTKEAELNHTVDMGMDAAHRAFMETVVESKVHPLEILAQRLRKIFALGG